MTTAIIDRLKSRWQHAADHCTSVVMSAFSEAGLDRNAPEHSEFFKSLYWISPANSTLKANQSYVRKVEAAKAKHAEQGLYVQVCDAVLAYAEKIVSASQAVEEVKAQKEAGKVSPVIAPVVASHNHKLVKVTKHGMSYLGHFADGNTYVIRRTGRHYTLAALRHAPVNGNMKHLTPGSYVSLHSVVPTGAFLRIVPVTV